ncbi:MAG: hypothetical protein ABI210_09480 [Abditibacteriaceae bacterium]
MNISNILCLAGNAKLLPVQVAPDGTVRFEATLPPGIYRATALLDASSLDWENFYYPLDLFNNKGRRTGPWDFDLRHENVPLTPAWWFHRGGERLGIVMAQRPFVSQVQNKRLQMVFCFEVDHEEKIAFTLEPITDTNVTALQFRIETEPDDRPVPLPLQRSSYALALHDDGALEEWARKLTSTHSNYQPLFEKTVAFAKKHPSAELLPLLEFARRVANDEQADALIQQQVLALVEMENWGNPDPAGYGHNADMGVAAILEPLSFIYHWTPLDDDLRGKLKAKLQLQMERFYTQLLLWNGFWGGSILQDHGHRSVSRFGVAAINLLGVLPDAEKWLQFTAQRMEKVLLALLPDGSIPFSSYHKVHLYMDDMTTWRDAFEHVTGSDIFDRPLFRNIISFVANRLYESPSKVPREVLCASPRGDRKDFYAGWGFFNAIACKFGDRNAARLSEILCQSYAHRSMTQRAAATFLTALAHVDNTPALPLQPEIFDFRRDSGLVNYRPSTDIQIAMRCAAAGSLHSYYLATGACDRIKDAPLEGHFTVSIGDQTLLLTAEGGYRMRSNLGCVLLIDGKGGYGDEDFAMGIPGVTYRGEYIKTAWHDAATGNAYVRMDLAPAYPRDAKVLSYHREFFLQPTGLLCRDVFVSAEEHEYSWHFQTYSRRRIDELSKSTFRISEGDAALTLRGTCLETELNTSIAPTEVVWAYQNENDDQPFQHIKYCTANKSTSITAEFSVSWDDVE